MVWSLVGNSNHRVTIYEEFVESILYNLLLPLYPTASVCDHQQMPDSVACVFRLTAVGFTPNDNTATLAYSWSPDRVGREMSFGRPHDDGRVTSPSVPLFLYTALLHPAASLPPIRTYISLTSPSLPPTVIYCVGADNNTTK